MKQTTGAGRDKRPYVWPVETTFLEFDGDAQGQGPQAPRQRCSGQRSEGGTGALEQPPPGKLVLGMLPTGGRRGQVGKEGRRLGKEEPKGGLGKETH